MNQTVNRTNPFVGLRPFESEDSLYYFGRTEQIKALLNHLHETRFLAVVGSSGSGKSSLVRAGLIPHLEAGFLVQDRDAWCIAKMKPGDQPLTNLAESLVNALKLPRDATEIRQLASNIREKGIRQLLKTITPELKATDSNLLLLVDQFEEIFRFGVNTTDPAKQDAAAKFVDLLLRLSREDAPIYVCLTMRSDYLGDCDAFHGLPEAMNASQYLVPRLTRQQRREAIEGPIRLAGGTLTPRLLDRLLNESGEQRDDLPVLQHALMRTWQAWAENPTGPLDTPHYEQIGGMHQALSLHAEEALNELDPTDQKLARRIFQAITETDAGNRQIRRPAHLSEIASIVNATPEKIYPVLQKFREDHRNFLVLSPDNPAENPLVDISHESLIRQWETLSKWVGQEAENAKIYVRLAETADLYNIDKEKGRFYRGPALQRALNWFQEEQPSPEWGERYYAGFEKAIEFLKKSRRERYRERQKEKVQQAERERLLREKNEQQRKALRQSRIFLAVITLCLIIALIAAWVAIERSREARNQTLAANYNLAKVFEERAMKYWENEENMQNAWLYETEALKLEKDVGTKTLGWLSKEAIFSTNSIKPILLEKWFSPATKFHTGPVNQVLFSLDGKILVSCSDDATIKLWDVKSGMLLKTLDRHKFYVNSIAFDPTGSILASGSWDRTIRLWDVKSGNQIDLLTQLSTGPRNIVFSIDEKIIISNPFDKEIQIWNLKSKEVISYLKGPVTCLKISPDGKMIASGSFGCNIDLWKLASGKKIHTLKGHSSRISCISYDLSGNYLVSGSADRTAKLWNLYSNECLATLKGHKAAVCAVAFSPNGKFVASGSVDKSIILWDVDTNSKIADLHGHTAAISSLSFDPKNSILASSSLDNTIRLWDLNSFEALNSPRGHSASITHVSFSPNSTIIASSSQDKSVRLWDVNTGKETNTLIGHNDFVTSVAINPDLKTIATASYDCTIRLWRSSEPKCYKIFNEHEGPVTCISFSKNGKILASGSFDKTVFLWNFTSASLESRLNGHKSRITDVKFSPNMPLIASSSKDKTIRIWNFKTGQCIQILNGHLGCINCLDFHPNGQLLASCSDDKTIRIWNVISGEELKVLIGHTEIINSINFHPEGEILVSCSEDKTLRFWNIKTGFEIHSVNNFQTSITSVDFNTKGDLLGCGTKDHQVRLFDTSFIPKLVTVNNDLVNMRSYTTSPDGKKIAFSTIDKNIQIFNINSGQIIQTLRGHTSAIWCLVFSPDSKILASGSWDNTIRLWDIETGKQIHLLKGHSNSILSIAFDRDGKILGSGSRDNTIRLWDVKSGQLTHVFQTKSSPVWSIAFSPFFLASGQEDGTIKLWQEVYESEIINLIGHEAPVIKLSFSSDARTLFSYSRDETIKVWDVLSQKQIYKLNRPMKRKKNHKLEKIPIPFSLGDFPDPIVNLGEYETFFNHGEPTPLFFMFEEALKFFWGVECRGLEFYYNRLPCLFPQDGYHFVYDPKFRPLLDPPQPGQSKFDQILEWAIELENSK